MAWTRRGQRWAAIAAGCAALSAVVVLGSRSRSFRAAYQAFLDPSRIEQSAGEESAAGTALEQPDIASDFGPASDSDLADGGVPPIASLTLPDLPVPISRRTMRFVAYFAGDEAGRKAFIERYRRGGRYHAHLVQALRDASLPEDLVWLAAIESGFNPQAVSPKGAVGMFQFMPKTAAKYGLFESEFVDERRSITRSTKAAVSLLHDLLQHYGRYDLALAAYNFGADELDDAIARFGARRGDRGNAKSVEFKDLAESRLIPKETANFVPQIQAFAIVAANRGRFGLDPLDPVDPFEFGEVPAPAGAPLRAIARAAGVPLSTLRDYNPDLLRDRVEPSGGDSLVNVPADRVAQTLVALPTYLAREAERETEEAKKSDGPAATAEGTASARRGGSDARAAPSASATASARSAPDTTPPDAWTLPNGIVVARVESRAREIAVSSRAEVLDVVRGRAAGGETRVFGIEPVTVAPVDLDKGLERAAERLRRMVNDGGDAAVELRRRVGELRRPALEKLSYGSSWVALGDALFPSGQPLAGTVLGAPMQPFATVLVSEQQPRGALRITVRIEGATDAARTRLAAERTLGGVLRAGAPVPPIARDARSEVVEAVPSPRVLFGWLAPPEGDPSEGALRLSLVLLTQGPLGRVSRALTSGRKVAARVTGALELGSRASVLAIELTPGVSHDVAEAEREMDRAIDALAGEGPSDDELAAAKGAVRDRLSGELARAGATLEPKDAAAARVRLLRRAVDDATTAEVRELVKKVLKDAHRVAVSTKPRG